MYRLRTVQFLFSAVLLIALSSPSHAGTGDFVGVWKNVDPHTRSIAYINVAQGDSGLMLSVFGTCHPSACPWGPVQARIYTSRVDESASAGTVVITGSYDKGFSTTEIVLELKDSNLRYETFTHFKDNSGRSDYFSEGILNRS